MVAIDVIINILITVVNYVMECTVEKVQKVAGNAVKKWKDPTHRASREKCHLLRVPVY